MGRSHICWTIFPSAVTVPSLIPLEACPLVFHSETASAYTSSRSKPCVRVHDRGRVRGHCTRRTVSVLRHAIARFHSSQTDSDGGPDLVRVVRRSKNCSSTERARACIASVSVHGCESATWEQWAGHTSTPSTSTAFGSPLPKCLNVVECNGQVGRLARWWWNKLGVRKIQIKGHSWDSERSGWRGVSAVPGTMRLRGVFDSGRVHQLQGSHPDCPALGAFPLGCKPGRDLRNRG